MLKSLKIFLIILGLGVFTVPTQMLSAQNVELCCKQKAKQSCCKTEKKKPCHSETPKKKTEKTGCGNDCANCQTCSVPLLSNYISPEVFSACISTFKLEKLTFPYEIPFFSSRIQNIWQPPKLS